MNAIQPFQHRRLRVYVAGPISQGIVWENVVKGLTVGRQMLADGLAPMVPHLDAFMTLAPNDMVNWQAALEWDLEWLAQAEALYRLTGPSVGASLEVAHAVQLGIEVFEEDEYEDLLRFADNADLRGKRQWTA